MAKPEWGQKRNCTSCSCRFYDMTRSPIICPKCGSKVEAELPFKVRRGGVPADKKAAVAAVVADDDLDATAVSLDDDDVAEEDDSLIEDTSDLGGDDDDMAEVIEHLDENVHDEV